MRLNRYIASATGLSRRAADAAISGNRVTYNGVIASVGTDVVEGDVVTLDGAPMALPLQHRYVALHKPVGYVSSRDRQGKDPIIYDLLPPDYATLKPAGRLDRESSGLILLSDDGDFILAVSHPSEGKLKRYEVELDHSPSASHLAELERGVMLEDGPSYMRVHELAGQTITLELAEGRNRQIRRTLGALGYGIRRLHRLSIGPYELGQLAPGRWEDFQP